MWATRRRSRPTDGCTRPTSWRRSFDHCARTAKAQQKDLALKERRQAAFVSDVAHELRTPLTAIRGNAEMLSDPDLPPEMHEKFLSIIVGESERLSRLTNDLLTLKRIENDHHALRTSTREPDQGLANERARHAGAHPARSRGARRSGRRGARRAGQPRSSEAGRVEPGGEREPVHRTRAATSSIELFGLRGNSIVAVKDDGCGFGDADPALSVRPLLPHRFLAQPRHGRHGPGAGHREVGGGGARRHRRGHQPARGRRLLHRRPSPPSPATPQRERANLAGTADARARWLRMRAALSPASRLRAAALPPPMV